MQVFKDYYGKLRDKVYASPKADPVVTSSALSSDEIVEKVMQVYNDFLKIKDGKSIETTIVEIFGPFNKPNEGLISYLPLVKNSDITQVIEVLCDLLLPDRPNSIPQLAMTLSKEYQFRFKYPIDVLPSHIKNLIDNRMCEYLPTLGYVLSIPIYDQKDPQFLHLDAWEFYLFCFFNKISRMRKSKVSEELFKSVIIDDDCNLVN